MQGFTIIGVMAVCALVPFAVLVRLVRNGRAGFALSILSGAGGCFVVLIYASSRPFGFDPVLAMSWALLFVLPVILGGVAGGVLGLLLRQRDDRR